MRHSPADRTDPRDRCRLSAAGLAAIDVIYVARSVIAHVYLIDAAVEAT